MYSFLQSGLDQHLFLVIKAQTPILFFFASCSKKSYENVSSMSGQGTLCENLLLNLYLPLQNRINSVLPEGSRRYVSLHLTILLLGESKIILLGHVLPDLCSVSWAFQYLASVTQICKAATWASVHMFIFFQVDFQVSFGASFRCKVLQVALSLSSLSVLFVMRNCWRSLRCCSPLSTAFQMSQS